MENRLLSIFFSCALLLAITASCARESAATLSKRADAGTPLGKPAVKRAKVATGYAEGDFPPFDAEASDVEASAITNAFPARYVILLLGDGMGLEHINAARIYRGGNLNVDSLRGPVMCRNNPLSAYDSGILTITDSAAAATAISTGHQVYTGVLSVDREGKPCKTVAEVFLERGKSVGLITNSTVLDASPMAMATHAASRYLYADIAADLFGKTRPDIVLGGWTVEFGRNDTEMAFFAVARGYEIVSTTDALLGLSLPWPSRVLGLFHVESDPTVWPGWSSGLTPMALRDASNHEPTLVEMARFALDRLSHNENGFFLFIEGEQADSIGEGVVGSTDIALQILPPEVAALDDALGVVLDWVRDNSKENEALVVFTADHETGGYTLKGNDLTQAAFTSYGHTLRPVPLYATGPGSKRINAIEHLTDVHRLLIGTLSPKGEKKGQ